MKEETPVEDLGELDASAGLAPHIEPLKTRSHVMSPPCASYWRLKANATAGPSAAGVNSVTVSPAKFHQVRAHRLPPMWTETGFGRSP